MLVKKKKKKKESKFLHQGKKKGETILKIKI